MSDWPSFVNAQLGGKRLPEALYLHRTALGPELRALVDAVAAAAGSPAFELVKLNLTEPVLSLLHYPTFDTDAFPLLAASTRVNLRDGTARARRYAEESAPVLHRKELLLAPGDPRFREWAAVTAQAEDAGLFDNPSLIGTRSSWEGALALAGLRVDGDTLVEEGPEVQRHRTAMVRYALSTPMQALLQHRFLDGRLRIFDYGCGRGGDLALLATMGVTASGWDPHFAREQRKAPADVVNLGFVLNVIESLQERAEALDGAWALAEKLLVVAVLLGGRSAWEKHRLYRDGVVTSKGTFQKYFSQDELRVYVEQRTGRQPVALAPGLFFVFRTDEDEQAFLADRQRSRRAERVPRPASLPRPERPARAPRPAKTPREPKAPRPARPDKWTLHADLLNEFWACCLDLGRPPENAEFGGDLSPLGTPGTVLRQCLARFGDAPIAAARAARMEDLSVWLALGCFERRRSYQSLPPGLRADLRVFWGGWPKAQEAGRELLFTAGNQQKLLSAARVAGDAGIGWLEDAHAFYVLGERVPELPALLRVFVGCAGQMCGDAGSADVVKIHPLGGKLTLLNYDDFGRPLPDLVERLKVDLRRQQLQFFSYDGASFHPQPLLWKSRLLPGDDADRERCERREARLVKLGFDLNEHIDRPTFEQRLASRGYAQRGWVLRKAGLPAGAPADDVAEDP